MKMLSPEELLELRKEIATLNLAHDSQDEMIRLIDNIIISIIDQEFGWNPVQISLSARANRAFSQSDSCGRVIASATFGQDDTTVKGVTKSEQSTDELTQ
jgi:hypothetical protein